MRTLLALAVLILLVSGCSSTKTADAPRLGTIGDPIATAWGMLPSYNDPAVVHFKMSSPPIFPNPPDERTAVIDVLVNHDGTVRDVAVYRSSGYSELDETWLTAFRSARFAPVPAENQSELYVVRQTMTSKVRFSSNDYLPYVPRYDTPNAYRY